MSKQEEFQETAPGWDAIDDALAKIYPDQEPFHYHPESPMSDGGEDPLDGISVYLTDEGGSKHWHFVTYGFTELFEKETEDSDYSGYGFELTMRVNRAKDESEPPTWALDFLQNLARYIFGSQNSFAVGHYMNLYGPISMEHQTDIRAICLVEDCQLQEEISTPFGAFSFLQIVGITYEELQQVCAWNADDFMQWFQEKDPVFLTDITRKSYFGDDAFRAKLQQESQKSPSDTEGVFIDQLQFKEPKDNSSCLLTLGASHVELLMHILPKRLNFDLAFSMVSDELDLILHPGKEFQIDHPEDGVVSLELPPEMIGAFLSNLKPVAGKYVVNDQLTLIVEKSEIKDPEGKVIEVVG